MPTLTDIQFPRPSEMTRMGFERDFERDYFTMRRARLFDITGQMGFPPKWENIEPLLWRQIQDDHKQVAQQHLSRTFYWSGIATGVGIATLALATMAVEYGAAAATAMAGLAVSGLERGIASREGTRRKRAEQKLARAEKAIVDMKNMVATFPRAQRLPKKVRDKIKILRQDLHSIVQFEDLKRGYKAGVAERTSGEPPSFTSLLDRLADEAEEELDEEAIVAGDVLDELTGPPAQGMVATEVTRAVHQGTEQTAQRVGMISFEDTWFTENDGRVCRICGPLHGRLRGDWQYQFPSGPPAHPRCRCQAKFVNLPSQLRHDTRDAA